jgi:hypothetical protein
MSDRQVDFFWSLGSRATQPPRRLACHDMVDCLHERLCMSASGKGDSPKWVYTVVRIEAVPILTDPQLVSRDLFNSLLGSILPVMSGLQSILGLPQRCNNIFHISLFLLNELISPEARLLHSMDIPATVQIDILESTHGFPYVVICLIYFVSPLGMFPG